MDFTLESLLENPKPFILAGGKGGTGKTTVSCSVAVNLAERGHKVLLISTDPAHSIGDIFDESFTNGEETKINQVKGDLYALEISKEQGLQTLKETLAGNEDESENGSSEFDEIFNAIGLGDTTQTIQENTPPGIDELLSLIKVIDFIEQEKYDVIVFDTAPTGHTLRLLALPSFLNSSIGRLLKVRSKLSNFFGIFKALSGSKRSKDDTVERLELLREKVEIVKEILQDPEKTEFLIVCIPTLLSLYESMRLDESLNEYQISHNILVLNMLTPVNGSCEYCKSSQTYQDENIKHTEDFLSKFNVVRMERELKEIRGINDLRSFSGKLVQ